MDGGQTVAAAAFQTVYVGKMMWPLISPGDIAGEWKKKG